MNTGSRFDIVRPCFLKKETENGQCEAQQSSKKKRKGLLYIATKGRLVGMYVMKGVDLHFTSGIKDLSSSRTRE